MSRVYLAAAMSVCLSIAAVTQGQQRQPEYPPTLDGANVEVYKTISDVKLNIYVFNPAVEQSTGRRSAAVFFFGGGWRRGTPQQFEPHCRYLASRGMVAMVADYRVSSRHNSKAVDSVADAKSALRWIRQHADRLGVDPDRVLAGGGSAGGHLAACTGTIDALDEPNEDLSISSKPNAMALFNPATVLAPVAGQQPFQPNLTEQLRDRMGVDLPEISPYEHVKSGGPPTVIFHGKADTTVQYWTAEAFSEAMKEAGNRCDLHGYEGQPHGFFNHGRSDNKYYELTLRELDKFLVSLGYLDGR